MSLRVWAFASLLAGCAVIPGFFWTNPIAAQPPAAVARIEPDGDPDADAGDGSQGILRSAERRSLNRRLRQAGFTPAEQAMIKDNCIFGMPKAETDLGPTKHVCRAGYVLEHSSIDKVALWVCEHSTKAEVSGNIPRNNAFQADPLLSGFPRSELTDYRGSGYDRGHMAPAGNQAVDADLKKQTFYLSNMIPQVGPTFNQGIWAQLEGRVRDWTISLDETWIITGPMFYDPLEEDPNTADGVIPYSTIGNNEVAVPTHCYKIVLAKENGNWRSIAFVMENHRYSQPYRFSNYIVTIDWIEERTGLNFFPNITSETANPNLELELESRRSPLW